ALADHLEGDLDLALGIQRPPPVAPGGVERALRLSRREPVERSRLLGAVVALDLGSDTGAHDVASAHLARLKRERRALHRSDTRNLVEGLQQYGHGSAGISRTGAVGYQTPLKSWLLRAAGN